jgi:hypothetical protein
VGDFFDIRRGIATGANDFFVMTRSQALERGIPRDFLKPVLTSPRRVRSDVIDADSEGVPLLSEMLFLLDCPMPPEEVKRRYPKLWEYLEQGRKEGKARGYLCRNREVWYWQERRQPALFLVSYMGRSSVERESPFRFFLNRSQAIATNCFLNLYPKPRVAAAIAGQEERARTLLHLLNSVARETSVRNGRSYGGGLHKMEPSELRSLPLGDLPDWLAHEREPAQLLLV